MQAIAACGEKGVEANAGPSRPSRRKTNTRVNAGPARFSPTGFHLKANEHFAQSKSFSLPGKTLYVSIPFKGGEHS